MNKEKTLKQICKMISSGDIPKEIYDKYLSDTPIGFMNSNDLFEYLENQELKKQLEEADRKLFFTKNELDMRQKSIDNKLTQQKEFIKYLEDEIKEEKDNLEKLCELCKIPKENNGAYKFAYSYIKKIEEILQKYKEIIGVSNDY